MKNDIRGLDSLKLTMSSLNLEESMKVVIETRKYWIINYYHFKKEAEIIYRL